jgi:hypothetical protein
VSKDPTIAEEFKADPVAALEKHFRPLDTDPVIYRVVVIALGAAVLVALIGAITLSSVGKDIPDVVTALGSAAVGALAGLLAPSPAGK